MKVIVTSWLLRHTIWAYFISSEEPLISRSIRLHFAEIQKRAYFSDFLGVRLEMAGDAGCAINVAVVAGHHIHRQCHHADETARRRRFFIFCEVVINFQGHFRCWNTAMAKLFCALIFITSRIIRCIVIEIINTRITACDSEPRTLLSRAGLRSIHRYWRHCHQVLSVNLFISLNVAIWHCWRSTR